MYIHDGATTTKAGLESTSEEMEMVQKIEVDKIRHDITKRMNRIGESARDFSWELYGEHLDEISYYYNQRVIDSDDPYMLWLDVEHAETRIDAHIEALIADGDLALDYCLNKMENGSPGVVYAAVRLLSHHKWDHGLKAVLESPNMGLPGYAKAVTDAFICGLPEEWHPVIRKMLVNENPIWKQVAADTIAIKRIPMEDELMNALNSESDEVFPTIIGALGRLRSEKARHALTRISMDKRCDETIYQACLALLRIHEKEAARLSLNREDVGGRCFLLMGLSGDDRFSSRLLKNARSKEGCEESLIALGLLGHMSYVDILIDCLETGPHSRAAALSLNLITGAELYETVFIPEPVEETPEENGLLYPSGYTQGLTVHRLTHDPDIWWNWWNWWIKNKDEYDKTVRYRFGKPLSQVELFQTLVSEKSPAFLRDLAYEERVIRYDTDMTFDIRLPVAEQRRILNRMNRKRADDGQ